MDSLRQGANGFKVLYLQRLLNKAAHNPAGRGLVEDGKFGHNTHGAVRAFQVTKRLPPTGVAENSTWTALGLRVEREHNNVVLVGQPDNVTCWSAAATEILGDRSVGQGQATLLNGGMNPSIDNLTTFANGLGWELLNYSPGSPDLVRLLQSKPLWFGGPAAPGGHVAVMSGVYSDGDAKGDGTMFRLHDPWPPNSGRIYGTFANPVSFLGADNVTWLPLFQIFVIVPS